MRDYLLSACTSYAACSVIFNADINWGGIGAAVLLVARLIQDVPKAYKVIYAYTKKHRKK